MGDRVACNVALNPVLLLAHHSRHWTSVACIKEYAPEAQAIIVRPGCVLLHRHLRHEVLEMIDGMIQTTIISKILNYKDLSILRLLEKEGISLGYVDVSTGKKDIFVQWRFTS